MMSFLLFLAGGAIGYVFTVVVIRIRQYQAERNYVSHTPPLSYEDAIKLRDAFRENHPVLQSAIMPEIGVMPEDMLEQLDKLSAEVTSTSLVEASVASAQAAYDAGDNGEEPEHPPMPNIGGEDNPPYAGPHLDSDLSPVPRYVPYDVRGPLVPGAAVTIVNGDGDHQWGWG